MGDKTGIEWTDASWNPVVGCSVISKGCTNCYAMKQAGRLLDKPGSHYHGTTEKINGNAVWTGKTARAPEHILTWPLRKKKPLKIFVNSMGDLFHENVPDEWIDRVFAIMALCPRHTFQILTKRAERMRGYFKPDIGVRWFLRADNSYPLEDWPHTGLAKDMKYLPNVWLGVSVEDQKRADERIPSLLETPAAVRFISAEPLLGPVDLDHLVRTPDEYDKKMPGFKDVERFTVSVLHGQDGILMKDGTKYYSGDVDAQAPNIDWVITGGESGPGARPMHPDWARSLRDQCQDAGVPFFFKQWGARAPSNRGRLDSKKLVTPSCIGEPVQKFGKKLAGRELDGKIWDQYPYMRGQNDDRP